MERLEDEIDHHIGHPTHRRNHPQIALRDSGIVGWDYRNFGRMGHGSMFRVRKGAEEKMTFGGL